MGVRVAGYPDNLKVKRATLSGVQVTHGALVVAILFVSTGCGLGIAIAGVSPDAVVAVAALSAIPLLVWATAKAPEFTVGFIVFSQIFEAFALNLPVVSLSPGKVALIIFLAMKLPKIAGLLNSPPYRFSITCLIAYMVGQGLQFLHMDAVSAARQMITASSFAMFAVLGLYVGARRSHVAAAAVGAATALLVLAGFGLAGDLGIGPFPAPLSINRAVLGVLFPFGRNLGLAGDGAFILFLLPLCIPWLTSRVQSPSGAVVRVAAGIVLALIWLASLLVFQLRTMVVEVPVGILLVWSLATRRFAAGIVLAGLCAAAALVFGMYLASSGGATSLVSTQLRTESYIESFKIFLSSPSVLVFGTDPGQFDAAVNASLAYGSQIPTTAPTHNLLIEVVLRGGLVSGIGLILLVIAPIVSMLRSARRAARFSSEMAVALSAVTIALLEASVWPGTAKAGPFWMTLGIAVAVAAGALQERRQGATIRRYRHGLGVDRGSGSVIGVKL
jgi:hypothetical protein